MVLTFKLKAQNVGSCDKNKTQLYDVHKKHDFKNEDLTPLSARWLVKRKRKWIQRRKPGRLGPVWEAPLRRATLRLRSQKRGNAPSAKTLLEGELFHMGDKDQGLWSSRGWAESCGLANFAKDQSCPLALGLQAIHFALAKGIYLHKLLF